MTVTFVSNYINHHQIPFCEAMYRELKGDFVFIQTEEMEEERVKMGWNPDVETLPYLRLYYKQEAECKKLIADSDVVLFGGVDEESYIKDRLHANKLVVRLSERIYKSGRWKAISPRGLIKKYQDHTKYRKKNVYLLCCGGYVAGDFHIVKAYPKKMFQWGYFPAFKEQNIEALLEKKESMEKSTGKVSLLWAGRFISWKHPEYAIMAAAKLKREGLGSFTLNMVGGGAMEEELKAMVEREGLQEEVHFLGFLKPEEVRLQMEESQIFLFTSDNQEGWGAVLNEAMNSGCGVVANRAIGAVPFLLQNGENGLVYKNHKWDEFYAHVKYLIEHEAERKQLGKAAYQTLKNEWNGEKAAEKLIPFLEKLMQGEVLPANSGILSPAEIGIHN